MGVIGSRKLDQFYLNALAARGSTLLSREDSVIQMQNGSIVGRKWVKLGSRQDDFRLSNLDARRAFYQCVVELFGGEARIPAKVREELQLADYKLENGEVTSDRPLTARRIIAVVESIEADFAAKADAPRTVYQDIEGFDALTDADKDRYRHLLFVSASRKGVSLADMSRDLSVAAYLEGKHDDMLVRFARSAIEEPLHGSLEDPDGCNEARMNELRRKVDPEAVSMRSVLSLVLAGARDRSSRELYLIFDEFRRGYADVVAEWLHLKEDASERDPFPTLEKFAERFDFSREFNEDELKAELDPRTSFLFFGGAFEPDETGRSLLTDTRGREVDVRAQKCLARAFSVKLSERLSVFLEKAKAEFEIMNGLFQSALASYCDENGVCWPADDWSEARRNDLRDFLLAFVDRLTSGERLPDDLYDGYCASVEDVDRAVFRQRCREYFVYGFRAAFLSGESSGRSRVDPTDTGLYPAYLTRFGRKLCEAVARDFYGFGDGGADFLEVSRSSPEGMFADLETICRIDELLLAGLDNRGLFDELIEALGSDPDLGALATRLREFELD